MSENGKSHDKLVNLMGRFVSIPVSVLGMLARGEINREAFAIWCFLVQYTTLQEGKDYAFPAYPTIMRGTGIGSTATCSITSAMITPTDSVVLRLQIDSLQHRFGAINVAAQNRAALARPFQP